MTMLEVRNTVVRMLHEATGRPVVLSDQAEPEPLRSDGTPDYPFIVYTATTPYGSGNAPGDHSLYPDTDGGVTDVSREDVTATYSFTAYSRNREENGQPVFGDDEVLELAECVVGWLRHTGRPTLSRAGVTVVDVMNLGCRSVLEIDETSRQYGFDVLFRFARTDERHDPAIGTVGIHRRSE